MHVVPAAVGEASRGWDEQHLALVAAARQVRTAPTTGFTSAVTGPAERFCGAWGRQLSGLADRAESHADGLRRTIADLLATDQGAGADVRSLESHFRGVR